jgi:type I restriction enzyme S subunit
MVAGLKPYPAYKDSGVTWLGRVPEHWEPLRFKYLLRERDARSIDGREQLLRVSQYTGVTKRTPTGGVEEPDTRAESLAGYKCVEPQDLVINIMLAWNGSMGVSRFKGIASPAYCVYRFGPNLQPWYFHYLLRSPAYKERIKAASTGVVESRLRLYTDDLYRLEALVPPLSEQGDIIRFLDHADRRIRRYIIAKQKLIKLLEEQKQAIVHRAVTRGLDPNVRLKPCGVEWLDDVPEHWEMLSLKRVLRRLVDCEHRTAPQVDSSDFRVVRTSAVRHGVLRLSGTYCTTSEAFREWTQRSIPEPGDVIFTREAPAGEACVVPDGASLCLGQRTVLMKVRRDVYSPQFLVHMIYAGPPRERIRLASQGSTVGHFNMDDIGWMHVLKPPLSEQEAILDEIEEQIEGLNQAMSRAGHEIGLLREYRTRLIADLVTGKLDVREAAAKLPDETDGDEAVDQVEALLDEEDKDMEGADLDAVPEEAET